MYYFKAIRVLLAAAASISLASMGGDASAAVTCKVGWPTANSQSRTIYECRTSNEDATGTVQNTTGSERYLKVKLRQGTVRARIIALNSSGAAITGCTVTDNAPVDNNFAYSAPSSCFSASTPTTIYISAD